MKTSDKAFLNNASNTLSGYMYKIQAINEKLKALLDAEQEAFDAASEEEQEAQAGQEAQFRIDALTTALDNLDDAANEIDSAMGYLEDASGD